MEPQPTSIADTVFAAVTFHKHSGLGPFKNQDNLCIGETEFLHSNLLAFIECRETLLLLCLIFGEVYGMIILLEHIPITADNGKL